MSPKRIVLLAFSAFAAAFAVAPPAFAETYGGQGIYGGTNPKVVTYAMLIVMCLFVAVIVVFSFIQAGLDHRKHARMDAAKHRQSAEEWKGGW